MLVLSAHDVDRAVSALTPHDLESLMASVFHTLSSTSGYASPHRTSISMARHTALFMPSRAPGLGTSVKVVSVPTAPGAQQGLSASTLVLDEATGRVKAVVNATALTALRTAAGSVLATRLLAASKTPKTLLAFGAGQQTMAHADLHLRAFPSLASCTIVNRADNPRLRALVASLRCTHPAVAFDTLALDDDRRRLEDAVRSADVICTATPSERPLFPSRWVSPGTHLNLVGSFAPHMHEIDSDLVDRAWKVVVDSRDACAVEAGELIAAGKTTDPHQSLIELGELLVPDGEDGKLVPAELPQELRAPGRVTIFKSVGIGLQDVAIATLVLSRAESLGYGARIDNYHA